MKVVVAPGAVRVDAAEDLEALSVAAPGMAVESVVEELTGRARVGDRDHVWIDTTWLRASAGVRPLAWHRRFDAMVDVARGHGWIDDTGWVRAHVAS